VKIPIAFFVPTFIVKQVSNLMSQYTPPAIVQNIILAFSEEGQIRILYQIFDYQN